MRDDIWCSRCAEYFWGTISAMNNLASTLADQGKLDEAANMKKEVLEKRTRILGAEPRILQKMQSPLLRSQVNL